MKNIYTKTPTQANYRILTLIEQMVSVKMASVPASWPKNSTPKLANQSYWHMALTNRQ
jgi:hypothetical protein